MHGVDLPVGDVDVLLRERSGVDALSSALSAYRCTAPPSYLEGSSQYFARFEVDGVVLEVSTVEAANAS
ncbi:MAG: hypothetical protein AB1505_36705, partial [Candidatus Latescibacterota bacterium]